MSDGGAALMSSDPHEDKGIDAAEEDAAGDATKNESTPSRIRTCDLRIRSPLLYPAELWARRPQVRESTEGPF